MNNPPVSIADWQEFIRGYSADLLRLEQNRLYDVTTVGEVVRADITDARHAADWLGHDAAGEEEVLALNCGWAPGCQRAIETCCSPATV